MNYDELVTKMIAPMTTEEAIALSESKWWESVGLAKAGFLQLHQPKLCMPFGKFHEALEFLLGRDVYKHEFARADDLKKEAMGSKQAPTLLEIIEMIPPEKRIVIDTGDD